MLGVLNTSGSRAAFCGSSDFFVQLRAFWCLLASERRKSDRPKLEARSTFMHDQEYSLRDWRAESSARSKRQCREDAARSRADASVQGEGGSLSALGRAFALQETRNELRGLKVY